MAAKGGVGAARVETTRRSRSKISTDSLGASGKEGADLFLSATDLVFLAPVASHLMNSCGGRESERERERERESIKQVQGNPPDNTIIHTTAPHSHTATQNDHKNAI